MADIKGFATQRGWTDATLITLLVEFIEDSNTVAGAMAYLHGVAEVEDEVGEEEWDDENDDLLDGDQDDVDLTPAHREFIGEANASSDDEGEDEEDEDNG
jgi:hypothetical protein